MSIGYIKKKLLKCNLLRVITFLAEAVKVLFIEQAEETNHIGVISCPFLIWVTLWIMTNLGDVIYHVTLGPVSLCRVSFKLKCKW